MSTHGNSRNNRSLRNIFINPKYQFRYILYLTFTGFLLVSFINIYIYSYVKENYLILVEMSPSSDSVKELLFSELHRMIFGLTAGSFIFLLLVSILGLFFSHRSCGAVFHVVKVMKAARSGDSHLRVNLRRNDEFKELEIVCNELIEYYEAELKKYKNAKL